MCGEMCGKERSRIVIRSDKRNNYTHLYNAKAKQCHTVYNSTAGFKFTATVASEDS